MSSGASAASVFTRQPVPGSVLSGHLSHLPLSCQLRLKDMVQTGALGPALQTLSTLPDGYNFHNHSSGKALNAEGGPASGPNSSGDFGNKAHVGT